MTFTLILQLGTVKETTTDETLPDEPPTDEPLPDERPTDEPLPDEPPTDEHHTDEPPTDEPPEETSATTQASSTTGNKVPRGNYKCHTDLSINDSMEVWR